MKGFRIGTNVTSWLLKLLAVAFLTSCASPFSTASSEIRGSVTDGLTGEPLASVKIGIVPWEVAKRALPSEPISPSKLTVTDNFGNFSFYLTGRLKKSAPFLLFTADEIYENKAYEDVPFPGVRPTRLGVLSSAEAYKPGISQPARFVLSPAIRTVDPVFIPMRDGVRLTAVMYMPKEEGRYPVILLRTPYGRHGNREYASIAREGYVIVSQDLRGRGDSEGENLAFINDAWGDLQDGYDTVEWLGKQPFCNGKVATAGGSALGITQELLAGSHPPHLSAQVIAVGVPSLYHYAVYPGGVYREEQIDGWLEKNKFDPKNKKLMVSHPYYDDFWAGLDLDTRIGQVDTPALLIGGWYDTFAEGTIASYKLRRMEASREARENTWLIMGPWAHGNIFSEVVGEVKFPGIAGRSFFGEILSFLNYYVKGIEGVFPSKIPKVQYYVMGDLSGPDAPGNFWMSASDFPPEADVARLFLTEEGRLVPDPPEEEKVSVKLKFDAGDPVPTRGGRNLNIPSGPMDQRPLEERSDVILFTSDTVTKPLPVVGLVRATLYVATEGKDADVSVRLTDVYPDGTSFLVLDATYRLSLPPPYDTPRDVKTGTFYELTADLGHTAYVFNRGHRIRIALAGSNYPRYAVNKLATSAEVPMNIFISLGKNNPSFISFPVYERVVDKFRESRSDGSQ